MVCLLWGVRGCWSSGRLSGFLVCVELSCWCRWCLGLLSGCIVWVCCFRFCWFVLYWG